MSNKHFNSLIDRGHVLGEVVGVDDFLVKAKGLQPIRLNALVMFEDGSKGLVRAVDSDYVTVLHLGTDPIRVGMSVVMQHHELVTKVGEDLIGRVVSVNGEPLDGNGAVVPDAVWPVFQDAPALIKRQELTDQLETGVTIVDTLFPLLFGQRLAILGDSKSGKSTFLTQLAVNQAGTDKIVVYVLIAKRKSDVDDLLSKLEETGAINNAIVIVSTMFDSLITTYLAPYVGCAMAEYLWQEKDKDVVIVYDDLTSHAQAYREISLLSGTSPGRDSYPGDMFFAHSSLLERAGRISKNGRTLTSLPAVLVPGGDVSTFLPTNIMSITDGQIIFDLNLFRQGIKPAVNTGLSVSRVGGHGHSKFHKLIASEVRRAVAKYYEAAEFSHFGTELAAEAKADLKRGERLLDIMKQTVTEVHSLHAQQIMLRAVMEGDTEADLDVGILKKKADELADSFQDDDEKAYKKAIEKALAAAAPDAAIKKEPKDNKQQKTQPGPEQTKQEPPKEDKSKKKEKKKHHFFGGKKDKKEEDNDKGNTIKPGDKPKEPTKEQEASQPKTSEKPQKTDEKKADKAQEANKPQAQSEPQKKQKQEPKEEQSNDSKQEASNKPKEQAENNQPAKTDEATKTNDKEGSS